MRGRTRFPASLLWLLACAAPAVAAEDNGILQQAHAWGRFGKGSWRQVRIVTEAADANGKLSSSTTDNTITVEELTPERVTLKVEVTVEVAGQRYPSPPQIIRQGFAGEGVGQTVAIKPLGSETVTVGGREIPCETEQIEILGGANKETALIDFSPRLMPPILKRRSTISDAASGKTTQEAVTEVYALNVRYKVLGETRSGYRVRSVQKSDRGTTTTLSVHIPEIPGEVVEQSSQKVDAEGRLERTSKLELVGYGVQGDDSYRDSPSRRARRHKRGR